MADILASVSVVLGADIQGFRAGMAAARKELRGLLQFAEGMRDVGKSLSTYVSAPLAALSGISIKLAGDMEKASVNFEVMLGSAEKATQVLTELKQFAAATPFEFPEIQDAAKKLLAFNTPAEELGDTLRQLGDVSAGIDAPIGEIAEIFGKARVQGRLFAEDINQLTGRGIPVIQEFAKQFGVTDDKVRKLVETGQIGFPQLQKAFASLTGEGGKFAGLMARQSETLPGLLSTAFDEIKGAATDLGTELVQAFDLKGALKGVIAFVGELRASFAALDPGVKKTILVFGAAAVAVGPLLTAVGGLITLLPALSAGFAALTGPIGLTILAVTAAATLIIANWGDIVAYFSTGRGATVFRELSQAVSEAMDTIQAAISSVSAGDTFATLFGVGVSAVELLKFAVQELAAGFAGLATTAGGVVEFVAGLFNGDFTQALEGVKKILVGLYTPLANLFGLDIKWLKDLVGLQEKGSGVRALGSDFDALGIGMQGLVTDVYDVGVAVDATVVKTKEAGAAIVALSQAQQKALDNLRGSLLENARLSQALGQDTGLVAVGDDYDYLAGKQKALQSGIQALIGAGFAPLGATVQGYVAHLRELTTTLDGAKLERLTIPPLDTAAFDEGVTGVKSTLRQLKNAFGESLADVKKSVAGVKDAVTGLVLPELPPLPAFDVSALQDSVNVIQDMSSRLINPLTGLSNAMVATMAAFNTAAEQGLENMNQAISAGLAEAAASMAAGIANVLSGAAPISSLGGILLGAVGDILIQLGKLAIATGIVVEAIKKAFTNPFTAIAAGVAAIALGSLVKGAATRILSGGGGGGVSMPSPSSYASPASTSATRPPAPQKVQVDVNVTGQLVGKGADLRAILLVDEYRTTRTS